MYLHNKHKNNKTSIIINWFEYNAITIFLDLNKIYVYNYIPCLVSWTCGISFGSLLARSSGSIPWPFVAPLLLYICPPDWSTSWLTPHENTNDANEWKCAKITIAWTTSANDQLSFPFVNF